MAIDLDLPADHSDDDAWGPKVLSAFQVLADTLDGAVTTAQSAGTLAGTVNTALAAKADATAVYTKTAADGRYVRTINSTTPDVNGNVTVSPAPGVRAIYWDGTGTQPLRSTASTDLTQPVIWYTPLAHPPTIATGYAIDGSTAGQAHDEWRVLP